MFKVLSIKEIEWKDRGSIIKDFEPQFEEPHLKVFSELLRLYSRHIRSALLNHIELLSKTKDKKNYCDDKWGIWKDEPKEWEKSLPLYLREETGFQLGEVVTILSGDVIPYVYYRPKDDMVFITDYYGTCLSVQSPLEEMKEFLLWWENKVKELTHS